jgi:hypothetical protein
MNFLVGLVTVILGVLVAGAGLPLFFILLPIWGFVIGFFFGAGVMEAVFGGGFLATTLGIGVGLVVGIVFAIFSYLYWYIGVLLSAGAAGFVLGAALLGTFGVSADWLIFIIGLIVAVAFVVAAYVINYPIYLVIAATALAGSAIAIGGILVLFGQLDPATLGAGDVWRTIDDHWFLWLIWLIGSIVGIIAQLQMISRVTLPDDKWVSVTEARA